MCVATFSVRSPSPSVGFYGSFRSKTDFSGLETQVLHTSDDGTTIEHSDEIGRSSGLPILRASLVVFVYCELIRYDSEKL